MLGLCRHDWDENTEDLALDNDIGCRSHVSDFLSIESYCHDTMLQRQGRKADIAAGSNRLMKVEETKRKGPRSRL